MPAPLQVGDRARLTSKYRGVQFHAGEKGTIVAVLSIRFPEGMRTYQVRLHKCEAALYPTFYQEVVEPESE
jgi:hypothetical protein